MADLGAWLRDGWRVVVVTEGHGLAKRVVELLGEHDLAARLEEHGLAGEPEPGMVARH